MLDSAILEVVVGVCLLFFVVSIACTALREAFEHVFKYRARMLWRGIALMLVGDWDPEAKSIGSLLKLKKSDSQKSEDLRRALTLLYEHPLIFSLFEGNFARGYLKSRKLPSYIPTNSFARAIFDIATAGADGAPNPASYLSLDEALTGQNLPEQGRRGFQSALYHARYDYDRAITNIELWFDGTMDRVAGWYKRQTQIIIFVSALLMAVTLNIDAVAFSKDLYRDAAARTAVASASERLVANRDSALSMDLEAVSALVASTELPIGSELEKNDYSWIGWLITALAATLGAPFWFDLLNKVMVIRSTVKPHEKSQPEGSEDRRNARPTIVMATSGSPGTITPGAGAGGVAQAVAGDDDESEEGEASVGIIGRHLR